MPLGTENVGYAFDANDFFKKFSFQVNPAQAALQILQQEGFITFNDPVFTPATVFFICTKEQLNVFENENPGLEPIIKNLLRSYAGIYDQPVPVYEKAIASSLKLSPEELTKGLLQLHKYQIILYNPQKETPRIYFNMARRKAADIRIDEEAYLFRKGQFVKRISGMLEYVGTNACRSQDIARYFGEKDAGICGVCDNCVKKAKVKLTASAFQDISKKLIEQTAIAPIDVKFCLTGFQI